MEYGAEDFFTRLRVAREEKGLSKSDMARVAGVSPSTYSKYETTVLKNRIHPKYDVLIKIARTVGKSIDWLVSGEETQVTPSLPVLSSDETRLLRFYRGSSEEARRDILDTAADAFLEEQENQ